LPSRHAYDVVWSVTGFDDLVKPINCQRNDNHLKLGNDGNLMKLRLRLTT
jgi:hypothetical protein